MELERSENILIVTHQAVLRCIYAYFMKYDQQRSPWLNVPLHTLIKLTPRAYGTQEEVFKAGIDAVSTWRAKGSVAKHEDPLEETESLGKGDKELAEAMAKVKIVQNGGVKA
jgi:6-phosphofructo-2-kinase / fructose-2,6-biphosphatase 2